MMDWLTTGLCSLSDRDSAFRLAAALWNLLKEHFKLDQDGSNDYFAMQSSRLKRRKRKEIRSYVLNVMVQDFTGSSIKSVQLFNATCAMVQVK